MSHGLKEYSKVPRGAQGVLRRASCAHVLIGMAAPRGSMLHVAAGGMLHEGATWPCSKTRIAFDPEMSSFRLEICALNAVTRTLIRTISTLIHIISTLIRIISTLICTTLIRTTSTRAPRQDEDRIRPRNIPIPRRDLRAALPSQGFGQAKRAMA